MYISQHAKGHNTLFPTRGEGEKTTFFLSSSLLVVLFFLSSLVSSSSFFARLIENRKCISSRIIIPSFREGFFSPSFNKTSLMRETRNPTKGTTTLKASLSRDDDDDEEGGNNTARTRTHVFLSPLLDQLGVMRVGAGWFGAGNIPTYRA